MNHASSRKLCLRILISLIAFMVSVLLYGGLRHESVHLNWLFQGPVVSLSSVPQNIPLSRVGFLSGNSSTPLLVNGTTTSTTPKLLGVASSIAIISLPDRVDRQQDMEALRLLLGIPLSQWRYTNAIGSTDKRVHRVMAWVQSVRNTFPNPNAEGTAKYKSARLDEKEIARLVKSEVYLDMWDTGPWPSPFVSGSSSGLGSNGLLLIGSATKDNNFPTSLEAKRFPNHKILTSARVACWYSHLKVIHEIANTPIHTGKVQGTHIVLEDDVDMEADVQEQIGLLWGYLPEGWDIVFLGHCWSNESYHPSLTPQHPSLLHALHPSWRPKCTHAYALSRTGARRFLLHLRYAPFAFSRAIDQAFAWLIESGRVKGAFSIVPSLVVQRKVRASDVFRGKGGKGSRWKEPLRNGVLNGLERG